jgi:hypothetical protein
MKNTHRVSSARALAFAVVAATLVGTVTLTGCSSGTESGGTDPSMPTPTPAPAPTTNGANVSAPTTAGEAIVGFWDAGPINCGGQFDIAYGFSICSNKKTLGLEKVAASQGSFDWLDSGDYAVSGDKVTLSLTRTVVDPAAIRGDKNSATLVLQWKKETNTFVVVSADQMPECTGLELKRTDTVTDSDCDPNSGSSGGHGGCTADSDCGSCQRCEQSTGKCLTKLTC